MIDPNAYTYLNAYHFNLAEFARSRADWPILSHARARSIFDEDGWGKVYRSQLAEYAARVPVVRLEVRPHPHSDAHDVAHFEHGRVVVPSGQFASGDVAAYLAPGAVLPDWLLKATGHWDAPSGHGTLAGPDHNRVRRRRMHGVVSLGLLYRSFSCEALAAATGRMIVVSNSDFQPAPSYPFSSLAQPDLPALTHCALDTCMASFLGVTGTIDRELFFKFSANRAHTAHF